VRRKPGLSLAEFRDGYENSHSRIAVRLFGHLWLAYRRNYLGVGRCFVVGTPLADSEPPQDMVYDAISEYILRDEAAQEEMKRIGAANLALIREDEARWFDLKHSWSVPCETIEEDLRLARSS
jgi:EthD domain